MRFIMRSSRVSMALLTLFPLAALVSKYGILQKTKNTNLHHTVYIHRRKKTIHDYCHILRNHINTVTVTPQQKNTKLSVV